MMIDNLLSTLLSKSTMMPKIVDHELQRKSIRRVARRVFRDAESKPSA